MNSEAIFSESNTQHMLMTFEAALARVQARRGLIPVAAAEEIFRTANLNSVPLEAVAAARSKVSHPMVALLRAWGERTRNDAGQWLHFGATTQDAFDTVQLAQLRLAAQQHLQQLRHLEATLIDLAVKHRDTVMIGRTLGRHALPITFGFKVATWAAENRRSIDRLNSWLAKTNTGVLSGAVGSYAALGDIGFDIEREVLQELGLGSPLEVDWKGSRDMHAEYGAVASIIAQSWRKIAQELFILQGDDIREVIDPGQGIGSSTMPHKVNPRRSRQVIALARLVPHHAQVLLDWMVTIHERDQISSADTLRKLCSDLDQLIDAAATMMENLVVLPENMQRNLQRTRGLIMGEAAMFLLASYLGKQNAHAVVHRASLQAWEQESNLVEALKSQPELHGLADLPDLHTLLDPHRYVGLCAQAVDRTIASLHGARHAQTAAGDPRHHDYFTLTASHDADDHQGDI
jgi:adenylosuccinate lyase